jgi:hypothetical protein
LDLKELIRLLLRIAFNAFLIELTFHLTSIYAIHGNTRLIEKCSKFTIAIALYMKGALFSSKYIVFYGLPSIINESIGIKTTPLPRCISVIHTNKEMWKYFDTGIYEFIKRY